jgi:Uma2 family endonuclease
MTEPQEKNLQFEMSSKNHRLVQARLAVLINVLDEYNVATELSLDISDADRQKILKKYGLTATRELKADVAVYRAEEFDFTDLDDEEDNIDPLRVQKMPICAMEIVSPSQSSYEILQKCRAYFAMGVKTCWLIDPNLKVIIVYSGKVHNKKTYLAENNDNDDVEDSILNVKISIIKLFGKKTKISK